MKSTRALVALYAVLVGLSGAWSDADAREKRVAIQGRVLSESGEGLSGWPVTLISTQRFLELGRRTSGGEITTVARTSSDSNGYFSIDVSKKEGFQFWFVRFMDPDHFDPVRYLPPEDVEITIEARRGRVSTLQKVIAPHPEWSEVQRRVTEAGGVATPKGKVLRTIGLPEKSVVDESSGEEEWWYFTKGIVYTFRGAESTGSRRFEPVAPPPSQASASGGGAPLR